jgi:hypothetical protein
LASRRFRYEFIVWEPSAADPFLRSLAQTFDQREAEGLNHLRHGFHHERRWRQPQLFLWRIGKESQLFQRLLAEEPLRPPALGSAKPDPTPAPTCWSLLAHHIRSFGGYNKKKSALASQHAGLRRGAQDQLLRLRRLADDGVAPGR